MVNGFNEIEAAIFPCKLFQCFLELSFISVELYHEIALENIKSISGKATISSPRNTILWVSRTNIILSLFFEFFDWHLLLMYKWESSARHSISSKETFAPSNYKILLFMADVDSGQTYS